MEVKASISTFTSKIETFTLTVTNTCASALITHNSCGAQSYTVGGSALTCSFTEWSQSASACLASFTYTASLDTGPLPSFIVYDSSLKSFTISTTDLSNVASYTIEITGALGSY
jgi:hypothetical protein